MDDSGIVFDIHCQIACCDEIIEWKVFWTYYEEIARAGISCCDKPISTVDMVISILSKVTLNERCAFECRDCKMECYLVSALKTMLVEREFSAYACRLLEMFTLYFKFFWISCPLAEQIHLLYTTILEKPHDSNCVNVRYLILFSFVEVPRISTRLFTTPSTASSNI